MTQNQCQVKQRELKVEEHIVVHKVKKIKRENSLLIVYHLLVHNSLSNILIMKYMDLMKLKNNYFYFFNRDPKDYRNIVLKRNLKELALKTRE
jgi:hypothetical protein